MPPEFAQGLFAKAGDHKVYMRMSTNAGDILPDAISLPRGLALKVLDVEGDRLPGADGTTQDFVMVNGNVFQAKTASAFSEDLKLLAKTTDRLEGTKKALSAVLRGVNSALETVGIESSKIASLGGAPNIDPLGEIYYSVTPFRFGDYIAKFSITPVAPALTVLTGTIRQLGCRARRCSKRKRCDLASGPDWPRISHFATSIARGMRPTSILLNLGKHSTAARCTNQSLRLNFGSFTSSELIKDVLIIIITDQEMASLT